MSCTKLQLPPEPLTKGLPPPDPRPLCPLSSTEFVDPPSKKKFLGTPLHLWGIKFAQPVSLHCQLQLKLIVIKYLMI